MKKTTKDAIKGALAEQLAKEGFPRSRMPGAEQKAILADAIKTIDDLRAQRDRLLTALQEIAGEGCFFQANKPCRTLSETPNHDWCAPCRARHSIASAKGGE